MEKQDKFLMAKLFSKLNENYSDEEKALNFSLGYRMQNNPDAINSNEKEKGTKLLDETIKKHKSNKEGKLLREFKNKLK